MTVFNRLFLTAYGLYAWSTFLILGLIALVLLLIVPGLQLRRKIGCICARLWLVVAGIRIDYKGADLLPNSPAMVVANHSSYIDGVLLKARFRRVIGAEH